MLCLKNMRLFMGMNRLFSLGFMLKRKPSTMPCSDMQWLCMTVTCSTRKNVYFYMKALCCSLTAKSRLSTCAEGHPSTRDE